MDRPAPNPQRIGGTVVTMLVTIGLAGYALAIPYLTPTDPVTTVVGPG